MIDHILLAILIQLPIALLFRNWTAGTVAACAWSMSRELTQAEYRWIEHYGAGLRANMPWWGGLDPRVWQYADPWLDWIVPSLTVIAVAFIAHRKVSRTP
jgi:hypothetical protein